MNESITQVKKDVASRKALKVERFNLSELLMDELLQPDEEKIVQLELSNIEQKLEKYSKRALTIINQDFLNELEEVRVKAEDLDGLKCSYIYPSLLVQNEITLIAAKPGSGKSLTMVSFSNMALISGEIDYVFYFDLDNSPVTLKERGIDKLEQRWGNRFQYFSPLQKKSGKIVKKEDIWFVIRKLLGTSLMRTTLIFDSAKNFLQSGADRDKNKDVSPLMDLFKSFRNLGATVMLLHHTNKPQSDLDELTYAGSSAWAEDSSNAFILKQNEYKKTFVFNMQKNRSGKIKDLGFVYNEDSITLTEVDLIWANETERDVNLRNEIIEYLKRSSFRPNYSQIKKELIALGHRNNDKINEVIQFGRNKFWKTIKLQENNQDIYELINSEKISGIGQISPVLDASKSIYTVEFEG